MLKSVEANLVADVLWLPLGALLLWAIRRVRKEIREDLAGHGEQIAAVHVRLDSLTAPKEDT